MNEQMTEFHQDVKMSVCVFPRGENKEHEEFYQDVKMSVCAFPRGENEIERGRYIEKPWGLLCVSLFEKNVVFGCDPGDYEHVKVLKGDTHDEQSFFRGL